MWKIVLRKLVRRRKRKRPQSMASKVNYSLHKESARKLVAERIEHWNNIYGFQYKKVSIRDQRTRWGSASRRGNLNFNYRIALLPIHLADYVIVHELCHLEHFNHSPKFWVLVAQCMPHHKKLRTELKHYGSLFRA